MHTHTRGRPRTLGAVLAAALAIPLAATGLGAGPAAGKPPDPSTPGMIDMIEGVEPGGTAEINLITGQRVTILSDPTGTYQIHADPTTGGPDSPADLQIRGEQAPGQPTTLVADPPGTAGLVSAGKIDPHLFDLSYLVAHGYGADHTPVTVHFQEEATPEAIAAKVAALPGARLVPDTATTRQATVRVPADPDASFWEAVTVRAEEWAHLSGLPAAYAPRELADGLAGLTLAGAALPAPVPVEPAAAPTHEFTIRVHASEDRSRWAFPSVGALPVWFTMTPIVGTDTFTRSPSFEYDCEDPECRTAVVSLDLAEGVWFLSGDVLEHKYGKLHFNRVVDPEVVIDGDTTLDLYLDEGEWLEPQTPQPTELERLVFTEWRTRPDGTSFFNFGFAAGDRHNQGRYLHYSSEPTTVGSFNVVLTQLRQQPRVSLSVARPKTDLDLRAQYDAAAGFFSEDDFLELDGERFELVDVGDGSAADFANTDTEGKLLLLGLQENQALGCQIADDVLQRANESGAVAVIVDPFDEFFDSVKEARGRCSYPLAPIDQPVPYLSTPPEHAAALRDLLAERTVVLEVSSPTDQRLDYVYEIGQHFSGSVPEEIDQTFSERDLVTRHSLLHGSAGMGDPVDEDNDVLMSAAPRSAQFGVIAGAIFDTVGAADEPVRLTEHIGPISPDLQWGRRWETATSREWAVDIFTESGSAAEEWLALPRAIGPRQRSDGSEAWTGPIYTCNYCRIGDDLILRGSAVSGAQPGHTVANALRDPVLTDADGTVIPLGRVHGVIPAYHLPPETQQYTLRGTDSYGTRYEWTFHSGTATDNRPPNTSCTQEQLWGFPCGEPAPLIYLRHETPVDTDNTAAAGSRHTVEVTAVQQAPDPAAIQSVTTQVSFDGGETWRDTKIRTTRDGTRLVSFKVPPLAETNGYVSLKTAAADAAGNTTEQTLLDVYELR